MATRSHIDVTPPSSVELDSRDGRELLQSRLGFFGLWNGILAIGFVPLRVFGELSLTPQRSVIDVMTTPSMLAHLGAAVCGVALWLVTRQRAWESRALRFFDAATTLSIGACFAVMGATIVQPYSRLIDEPRVAMLTATLAVALTMNWRATAVPSPPQRTAVLSALGLTPLIITNFVILSGPGPAGLVTPVFTTGWAVISLATSTVTSFIVYGLRREVQRAQRLGQYTLDEKIGEGAMGVVYRAHHAMLRRPTAIKLLAPGRTGAVDLQRFEREVQLTALLTHPNTVAIYDYGRTPDGVFYYAMELLDGINLEELVKRHGPQPAGRVISILRQVCRALAEAHALGVIHRDIKPANVILTVRGGEPDVAKVVDFGLVKCLDPVRVDLTMTLDTTPVLAGTPMYFPPEAISDPDHVEARSDLYSLGGVGYYLLTAKTLFESGTVMELCGHHLHTAPVPPSVRAGRPVDRDLETLLMACLAKSADDRPASALALDAALGGCRAAASWSSDDARRWWDSHGDTIRSSTPVAIDGEAVTIAVELADR